MLAWIWKWLRRPTVVSEGLDIARLRDLIGRPDPVILDIGCNDGAEVTELLTTFPKAQIYCFEPDVRARERFRQRIKSERVRLFETAIGAVDGTVDFHVSGGEPPPTLGFDRADWDLSGSIRRPKGHYEMAPWVKFDTIVQVPISRLDTWSAEHGIEEIDLIWADVQGAEGDLVDGGPETLKRTRFLFTEYHDHELYEGQVTLDQLLERLPGFEPIKVFPCDVLLRNTALT